MIGFFFFFFSIHFNLPGTATIGPEGSDWQFKSDIVSLPMGKVWRLGHTKQEMTHNMFFFSFFLLVIYFFNEST